MVARPPKFAPQHALPALIALAGLLVACSDGGPPGAPSTPGAPTNGQPGAPSTPGADANGLPGPPPPGLPGPPPGGATGGGPGKNVLSFGAVDLTRPPPADARAPEGPAACLGCDVVLVTICSLRRDHVGAFGGPAGRTPTLDRLAADAVRFEDAWAASNFTLASLTAIFTADFPSTTGVLNWDRSIDAQTPLLPEVFGYYGYATGAFTVDAPSGFRPEFGLDRGFQRMVVSPPPQGTPDGRHGNAAPDQASAAQNAAAWITAQPADQPIFVAYHDRNAHYPYVVAPPDRDPTGVLTALWEEGLDGGGHGHRVARDPVAEALHAAGEPGAAAWRAAYAEAVRRMDTGLGTLLAALDARGRRDHTILVVVADHGESLDQHGELLHGISYFEPAAHTPLLVSVPGVTPRTTPALASHVDLFPTLAELVGIPAPAGVDGVSLVPVLSGAAPSVRSTLLVEGGVMLDRPDVLRGAVVAPPWTLLVQPPVTVAADGPPSTPPGTLLTTLYDLRADPGQLVDVAAREPAVVETLRARWEGFRAARAGRNVAVALRHDPEFVELLRRTGYDFRPTTETPPPADPRTAAPMGPPLNAPAGPPVNAPAGPPVNHP